MAKTGLDEIPANIDQKLSNLELLGIFSNRLRRLPRSLSNLKHLKSLYMTL